MQVTEKIYIENCDNIALMARYPDNYFDLAIVDLEYGIGASKPSVKPNIVKQSNGTILKVKQSNYAHKNWDLKLSSNDYLDELFRVSKNQIIWGGNYYGLAGGYLVWDKLNGDTDQFDCEMAWISFTKRTDLVYYMWSGMFQGLEPSQNIRVALEQQGNKKLNEPRIHPTQKPAALYKWLLEKYSKPNFKILDTHFGSGSIAVGFHDMIQYWISQGLDVEGAELVACELDKDYYTEAIERIKKHTAQLSLFAPEELLQQSQTLF